MHKTLEINQEIPKAWNKKIKRTNKRNKQLMCKLSCKKMSLTQHIQLNYQ